MPFTALKAGEIESNMDIKKFTFDLITEAQLCDYLGVNRVTIWRYRKAETNPLKMIKIKGLVRYSMSDILKWLEAEVTSRHLESD